jgi:tetratricopeptide (TPR) repeat protein
LADRADVKDELANAHHNLGIAQAETGSAEAALGSHREALRLYREAAAEATDAPVRERRLRRAAEARLNGAKLRARLGEQAGAIDDFRASIAELTRLYEAHQVDAELAESLGVAHLAFGESLGHFGDGTSALDEYAAAVAVFRKLSTAEPSNRHSRLYLSMGLNALGAVHARGKRFGPAVVALIEAVCVREVLATDAENDSGARSDLAKSMENLARVHRDEARAESFTRVARRSKLIRAVAASGRPEPVLSFHAACVIAGYCPHVPPGEAGEYAAAAIAMLRRAVQAGFADAAAMESDEDLKPLRDREDFKKVLADVKLRAAAGGR